MRQGVSLVKLLGGKIGSMNSHIRELFKRDHGIDIKVSTGNGTSDDPYVVDNCSDVAAALTQVKLLRGITRVLSELWHIVEWKPCDIGSATEVIRYNAIRFTQTQIETTTHTAYFDTRAVVGAPYLLHPLTAWRGPPGSPILPYELGWLHFDKAINNSPSAEKFDQTVLYSGAGARAGVNITVRTDDNVKGVHHAELKNVVAMMRQLNPKIDETWPVFELGPFAMKFLLSGSEMTAVGVAVSGTYLVKVRLTFFDDLKMRELMNWTLSALATCVQNAAAVTHVTRAKQQHKEESLLIVLGAPLDELLKVLFDKYQESKITGKAHHDGDWESFEREFVEQLFAHVGDAPSTMDELFSRLYNSPIKITDYFFSMVGHRGFVVANIRISRSNVLHGQGSSISWPPPKDVNDAAASALNFILKRNWVRVFALHPEHT